MMSSRYGVAIIALPSGVITASYLDELRAIRKENQRLQEQQQKESEQNNQ
jgi:voltage-gated potassium channel